jgi:P-type conjugative transfer protein TrbJ
VDRGLARPLSGLTDVIPFQPHSSGGITVTSKFSLKKCLVAGALSLSASGALIGGTIISAQPAEAQWTVFDPANYSQNILTAARTLMQINHQIQMLTNQAQMLLNQAKNLTTISFPELSAIQQTIQKIDQLMTQAQGIQFHVKLVNQQFSSMYPSSFNTALTTNQQVIAAQARLSAAMAAYQQTMTVQAQVVENISTDESTLAGIVARSQGAVGALQVGQATNQFLALIAKQEFQLQHLLTAQLHADAIGAATRTQAQSDAQGATTKFLGSGTAYTPQ